AIPAGGFEFDMKPYLKGLVPVHGSSALVLPGSIVFAVDEVMAKELGAKPAPVYVPVHREVRREGDTYVVELNTGDTFTAPEAGAVVRVKIKGQVRSVVGDGSATPPYANLAPGEKRFYVNLPGAVTDFSDMHPVIAKVWETPI